MKGQLGQTGAVLRGRKRLEFGGGIELPGDVVDARREGGSEDERNRNAQFGGQNEGEEEGGAAGEDGQFVRKITHADPTQDFVAQRLWLNDQDAEKRTDSDSNHR